MNKEKLKYLLKELNVNEDFYSLEGDLFPDRIVLYNNYNKWEVFYFNERGGRDNHKEFNSESEACMYMYDFFKTGKK